MKSTVNLSPIQVRVLYAISQSSCGMTRSEIESKVGYKINDATIGPIYAEDVNEFPESLYALGYVTPNLDEDSIVRWHITETGSQVAKKRKPRKEGLRTPQIRILRALASASNGLTRPQIATLAKVSLSMTGNLGPYYHEDIERSEQEYGKRSLMGWGYVTAIAEEDYNDVIIRYHITKKGRMALVAIDSKSKSPS